MSSIATLIKRVMFIALTLAALGKLPQATIAMMKKAAEAQQAGLISLSKLNHSLVDPVPPKRKAHK